MPCRNNGLGTCLLEMLSVVPHSWWHSPVTFHVLTRPQVVSPAGTKRTRPAQEGEEEEGEVGRGAVEEGEEAKEGRGGAEEERHEDVAGGGQVGVKRTCRNAARRLSTLTLPEDTPKAKVLKCLADPAAEDLGMDIPTVLLQK